MTAEVHASQVAEQTVREHAVAHWQTWRPYTTCYPAMLGLAGVLVAGGDRPGEVAAAVLAPVLGWISGHYLGDHFDRHLDAIAKPQRPIPSGRMSPAVALAAGIGCAVVSLVIAAGANWRVLPFFALAIGGIVSYSAVFKRLGFSGNLSRGVLSALALVIGAMVAVPWPPAALVPVAVGFLLHDTASNLIGTVRDVDGDRAGGYRSVPVRHGVPAAVRLAAALWLAGTVAVGAGALVAARPGAQLALVAAAVVLGGCALWTARPASLTPRRALRSHETLVAERLVLTAAVVAGAAGPVTALLVLVPALAFSLVLQGRMRSRHEFPDEASNGGERS
ncbi:4-hydroxybenzoate polyprenyltransferase/geranylgeranylglycerol-phosphate geranylgeranyltransferase [Lentzea xinjiangensis]|uniref:4-hydroxybenzoate polyprenyltransferase/geranylgeranylglycerol-phosphate geranylgeranyltransferase n=1 Tax=Lentzea xinjiangensis TaxID=402600 RepID=A0A1H9UYE3_9PSEU|nr:UbiA family prenyltransferase [Lentzea xinjiangensis]SES14505.1 4-hydroxybenzoate polyprenyltransferase/geranylgeranylglycerol-phosphate geranylgeranyltransferase [Lentzea xinjiangensis]